MTNPSRQDVRSLATSLLPHLEEACGGCLGDVIWFKADWQRGGAATGRGTWTSEGNSPAEVIVKIPVRPRELIWIDRLQHPDCGDELPVVPRLYASGTSLGGYDLAWIVIEKIPHGPLGMRWHKDHVRRVAEAAARFSAATDAWPADDAEPRIEEWSEMIDVARRSVRINEPADQSQWSNLLKRLHRNIDELVERWRGRETSHWIHGDLHLANALSREGMQRGPVTLIDLAEVRPGHWLEDAVFLERQLWAAPDRLVSSKPVKAMVKARRDRGLGVEARWEDLAMIRRALLAGTAPTFIRSEGHPAYFTACLKQLERSLNALNLKR